MRRATAWHRPRPRPNVRDRARARSPRATETGRRPGPAMRSLSRHPLGVEQPHPHGDGEAAEDPHPYDHGDLAPAERLEVVMHGRHPPEAFALGELEVADL